MVKVFTTDSNGKISFTKEELETLLNEVWNDGYNRHSAYWWTSPTTAPSITTTPYDPSKWTISTTGGTAV